MSLSPIISRLDHIDDHQLQRLIALWQVPPLDIDREAQRIARALELEQRHRAAAGVLPEASTGTTLQSSHTPRWRFWRRWWMRSCSAIFNGLQCALHGPKCSLT